MIEMNTGHIIEGKKENDFELPSLTYIVVILPSNPFPCALFVPFSSKHLASEIFASSRIDNGCLYPTWKYSSDIFL